MSYVSIKLLQNNYVQCQAVIRSRKEEELGWGQEVKVGVTKVVTFEQRLGWSLDPGCHLLWAACGRGGSQ